MPFYFLMNMNVCNICNQHAVCQRVTTYAGPPNCTDLHHPLVEEEPVCLSCLNARVFDGTWVCIPHAAVQAFYERNTPLRIQTAVLRSCMQCPAGRRTGIHTVEGDDFPFHGYHRLCNVCRDATTRVLTVDESFRFHGSVVHAIRNA